MNKRYLHYDLLRILAIFAVIVIHVVANDWYASEPNSKDFIILTLFDSIARFCVPIFLMISGIFLLDKNKSISTIKIYKVYIPRLLIAFSFWSLIYTSAFYYNFYGSFTLLNVKDFIEMFIIGRYHMWYMWLIMGIYVMLPFLRQALSDNKKMLEYYILIFLVFSSVMPVLSNFANINIQIQSYISIGFTGYIALGYYLNKYSINRSKLKLIYILGVSSLFFTFLITIYMSTKGPQQSTYFFEYLTPNVLLMATALFCYFKYEVSKIKFNYTVIKTIHLITPLTLTMYLSHDLFNILFRQLNLSIMDYNLFISIPLFSIVIFFMSAVLSFVLLKAFHLIKKSRNLFS